MPITHIQSATVCVSDQDKALDFFVNKLGFEVREDAPFGENQELRWIEVAPPGAKTVLVLARGFGGCIPERIGKFSGIVFEADDIHRTCEELQSRGVNFLEGPTMQAWGMYQAIFEDPDGNRFALVSEPVYIQRRMRTTRPFPQEQAGADAP
jgi:catechol 2,3-dioxygenase-like lactoylglutathione lyase family enzyme